MLLKETRRNYSSEEKTKILRQSLYNQLRTRDFKKQNSHVKLEFGHNFELDDAGNTKMFTLCESCHVIFNDHIRKNYYLSLLVDVLHNILVHHV